MAAWTLSLGRGGYFFEESRNRSPDTTSANIINPSMFFIRQFYHKSETGSSCKSPDAAIPENPEAGALVSGNPVDTFSEKTGFPITTSGMTNMGFCKSPLQSDI